MPRGIVASPQAQCPRSESHKTVSPDTVMLSGMVAMLRLLDELREALERTTWRLFPDAELEALHGR